MTSSQTLFWEEEVPGKTQLKAEIISSYLDINKVTFYVIELKVTTEAANFSAQTPPLPLEHRTWKVKRRYSEFASLHKALQYFGFPCPSLPPKQLWGGHTSVFMSNRQSALNCWIQGLVLIWQSAAPNRGPSVAYAIGEMLEAFLCSIDSDSFYKVLDEVQVVNEILDYRAADVPDFVVAPPPVAVLSPEPEIVQKPHAMMSFASVAQKQRLSKVRSTEHLSKMADLTKLRDAKSVTTSPFVLHDEASLLPPPPSSSLLLPPPPPANSPLLGVAVDMRASHSRTGTQYSVFNAHGQRIAQQFHPTTYKVMYHNSQEEFSEMKDASTPVSVPPTPNALNHFNAQWNNYTSSVLEFVQERLDLVQRSKEKFNILDRHAKSVNRGDDDDDDDEDYFENDFDDAASFHAKRGGRTASLMMRIDVKHKEISRRVLHMPKLREDMMQHGFPLESSLQVDKDVLTMSYIHAGEHLIHTILNEVEADITEWTFISNNKDVNVMRRQRPIKRRHLLRLEGAPSSRTSSSGNLDFSGNGASVPVTTTNPSTTSSQHCFMGRGIVDAPAEEIFDLVRRPDKRHFYDSMLNEELVLENLAVGEDASKFADSGIGNLLVYYHLFETNRCFLRYVRDFCVLAYAKKVVQRGQTTKYVVVGASVNHAQCPVREDVERATLDLFGWVVEPTSKANQSKVSYIMHIDFGQSGVPTHLLNTISFRQPLAVHYLRRHIRSIPPEQRKQNMLALNPKKKSGNGNSAADSMTLNTTTSSTEEEEEKKSMKL